MARKRKRATTPKRRMTTRRRASVGGAVKFDATHVIMTAAGSVAATLVDKIIPTTLDNKIKGALKIGVGAMLPMIAKKVSTQSTLQSIGGGMIAVGTGQLLGGFGLAGFGAPQVADDMFVVLEGADLPVINDDVLNGDDLPIINDDVLNDYDDLD